MIHGWRRIGLATLLSILLLISYIQVVYSRPSGEIDTPIGTATDNILTEGSSENITVTFKNTGDENSVASAIQYIAISVANPLPLALDIKSQADWEIFESDTAITPRTSGTTDSGSPENTIFAPISLTTNTEIHTWELGKPRSDLDNFTDLTQFTSDLKVLMGGETLKLRINVTCSDGVGGDPLLWFFFRATEDQPTSQNEYQFIGNLTDKKNLYYTTFPGTQNPKLWFPLHNSFDPYDADINDGHVFDQGTWQRSYDESTSRETQNFAKGKKTVHQKPDGEVKVLHICGNKFEDSNLNGVYDKQNEVGIGGVTVTLLGSIDPEVNAEVIYPGFFTISPSNPRTTNNDGTYCWNLYGITPELYSFWIKEEVPNGYLNTTERIIGPIIIGPTSYDSLGNDFGNMFNTDFGDAPDDRTGDYPTFQESDGARHIIGDIWLGAVVDGENDGQPEDQDDVIGLDDEDGVVFIGDPWIVGTTGSLQIFVNEKTPGIINPSNPAFLHGWIDWNQDGDWNDLSENIFCSYRVESAGSYAITFPVPSFAAIGSTWARFRLDNDTDLNSPKGLANNGEVEDYFVDPAVGRESPVTPHGYVGGEFMPTNKLSILAPYFALIGLFVASAIAFRKRIKKSNLNLS